MYFTISSLLGVVSEANSDFNRAINSSDLTLAPMLKLVPGLIPGSSERVCLLLSLGIKFLPFEAKLQYWSYVEYGADQKPAKVMYSSRRMSELHTAFIGRSRSLLLTLESTFTSQVSKPSNCTRVDGQEDPPSQLERPRGAKGMREQEVRMTREGA